MTYFWETVDTIAPGLGWPHFGPFHLAVLAVFLLLGAVLCRSYCGMDTDKRRRWRRTVALLLIADELFKDFGLLYGGNFSLDYLPLHLCSINIFLIALHAWRRPKLLDTFLYFVCLPAACAALLAAMAVPIWFFNRAFGTNFMFLMRAGEGNPLKLFERFGSHLLGYPVLLAVVFAVMYLLLRVLRRRTAVPAGK